MVKKIFSWRRRSCESDLIPIPIDGGKIFNELGRGRQPVHPMEQRIPPQRRQRWYAVGADHEYYDPSPENLRHAFTMLVTLALAVFAWYFLETMVYQCPYYRMYRYGEAVTRVSAVVEQYKSCMYFGLQVRPTAVNRRLTIGREGVWR
jgi:hypothetical protein